jgi:hypothetical protein
MFASSFLPHLKAHTRTTDVDICDRAIPSVLRHKPDFRDTLLMPGAAVTFLISAALLYPMVPGGVLAPLYAGMEASLLVIFAISALRIFEAPLLAPVTVETRTDGRAA